MQHLKNLGLILQRNLRPARRLPARMRRTRGGRDRASRLRAGGDHASGRDTSKEKAKPKKAANSACGALLIASRQFFILAHASRAAKRVEFHGKPTS